MAADTGLALKALRSMSVQRGPDFNWGNAQQQTIGSRTFFDLCFETAILTAGYRE